MCKKYGYIRVSTLSQDFLRQQLPLKEYGIAEEDIFEEKVSGTKKATGRPAFEEMVAKLENGDECVFESMSRMARSMQDLIYTTNFLVKEKNVKVVFLKENISVGGEKGSDSAMTSLIFNIMGSFAQFERDLIADRTKQGIKARKEFLGDDFKIGHPPIFTTEQKDRAKKLLSETTMSCRAISRDTGICLTTIARWAREFRKGEK